MNGYSRENLIDNIYSFESYMPGEIWAATVDFALKNNGADCIEDLSDSAVEDLFNELFDRETDLR